ncbi:MAG: hypothetical protein COA45_11380 [Zetaproteobacteria bacterium]|nr:MAG: hypothetical protein COA45_11380 [Zetaproteobacteria bacterium]
MWHKCVLISLLLFIGIIGIGLKMMEGENIARSHKREIKLLTQYMSTRGLIPTEIFNLNKEGSFTAHVYHNKKCDGGWLISPMFRNSEAVSLFTRQGVYSNYPMGPVFYLLGGKTYEAFPDLGLWLSQKTNAVKYIIGLSDSSTAPVFAMRQFGHCQKENKL